MLKAGEGNPQAREEEGKRLLGLERSSSLAAIPGIWELEFHGKATALWGSEFHEKATAFNAPVGSVRIGVK